MYGDACSIARQRWRTVRQLAVWGALLCFSPAALVPAQGYLEPYPSPLTSGAGDPLQELLDRLHAAEQRIQELEGRRLPPVTPYTNVAPESYFPVMAEDSMSLEDRIGAIEEQLKKDAEAAAKKKASDAKKPTQQWTGRIHVDHWAFPQTSPGANAFETNDATDSIDDRFLFRRVRIGIQGSIPDNMQYKLEVDFNNPATPQFKDMYLGWNELPFLRTLLVGNQKRPYGLDHLNSSRYNVFIERPAVVEGFNQDARRFGIASYGVSENLAWNWRFGGYMSQDMQTIGTVTATPITEDYQAEFAGRLANTIWYDEASDGRAYAHWAISGTTASTDPAGGPSSTARFQTRPEARTSSRWLDTDVIVGADNYQLGGLEGVINLGPLQAVGEYMRVWMQRENASDLQFDGGYVYLSYFLTGEHMAWERATGTLARVRPHQNFFRVRTCDGDIETGWGAWQVAIRYSVADFSDENILGGESEIMTLGLNWYWNAYAHMQFNYQYGDIENRRAVSGQTNGDFHIIGTRFQVDF